MATRNKPISYTLLLVIGALAALFHPQPAGRWIGFALLMLSIGVLTRWGAVGSKRRGG